jgi:hypothetical protein
MPRILAKNPSKNPTYRPENSIAETYLTNGKGDYDGDHCDDQIEEQGQNVNDALNDGGQVGCEIESQAFHLLCSFLNLKRLFTALITTLTTPHINVLLRCRLCTDLIF